MRDSGRADKRSHESQEIAEGVWCGAPASSDSLDGTLAYRVVGPGRRDAEVAVPSVVSDDVLTRIGDMGGEGRQPIEDREHLEVTLEHRAHLGAVDHGPALRMIPHLLLGER
jgi:hypothetical protein